MVDPPLDDAQNQLEEPAGVPNQRSLQRFRVIGLVKRGQPREQTHNVTAYELGWTNNVIVVTILKKQRNSFGNPADKPVGRRGLLDRR